jgi:hypothetical protein
MKKCCKCDNEFETPGIQCTSCRDSNLTTKRATIDKAVMESMGITGFPVNSITYQPRVFPPIFISKK